MENSQLTASSTQEDDGFTLFESRAISRYIVEKYATQGTQNLLPSKDASLKEKALFEQAASIELSSFEPHALDVILEKFFAQYVDSNILTCAVALTSTPFVCAAVRTPDEDRITKLLTTITSKLTVYDKILGNQQYLAGEHVTLADLWHLPLGFMLEKAGYNVMSDEGRPNVARYAYFEALAHT